MYTFFWFALKIRNDEGEYVGGALAPLMMLLMGTHRSMHSKLDFFLFLVK
jgi:hypothetical protein